MRHCATIGSRAKQAGLGWLAVLGCGAGLWVVSAIPLGCATEAQALRRREVLLRMAAEEAGKVDSAKLRLKQQLYIADIQNRRAHRAGARLSLQQAWRTLEEAGSDLDAHTRLAGWVSISELSRGADDADTAARAAQVAEDQLLALPDKADRCQYVLDLATELRAVFDRGRAVKLLVQAGPWTREIQPQSDRRDVLIAFADRLLGYEAYEQGREVIGLEDEAYWRSHTLVQLSGHKIQSKWQGKQLDYENTFNSTNNALGLP